MRRADHGRKSECGGARRRQRGLSRPQGKAVSSLSSFLSEVSSDSGVISCAGVVSMCAGVGQLSSQEGGDGGLL